MHYSVFMEDYLDFDDWHDQENEEVNFNDSSSEERLIGKLRSDDHYFRKQGLSDLLLFLQQNTHIDVFPSVFEAVKQFSTDSEPSLRSDFAESLTTITQIGIAKNLTEWSCVENFTIPSVVSLLHDTNKQIRLASHSTIVFLLENNILTKELFFSEIYSTLEEMMVSYNPDEFRTECFTLLVQVSQFLPHCLEENMLGFCRDFISANDNLRKTCASYLLNIINSSSDKHLDDWLEIFYKLSDDNSWYVKKFCIECAVALSRRVTRDERWTKMSNAYYHFMTDSKKWVATCAFQNFGAFIATFSDPSKSQCAISEHNTVIITVPTQPITDDTPIPRISPNNNNARLSDSDSSFSTFCYWQQPIDDSLVPQVSSPTTLSIRDIDLNQSESPDLQPYCWPPDLSRYKQDIIPHKLLQTYSNIIHEGVDVDLIRPCAFSMPAVLVTLGPSCWPYLKAPYTKLVQFMSWKVRLSLATSLHHVFQIFRYNDSAVDDLLSAYKELIKDVDEVKCGLMAHISQFYLDMPIDRYPIIFEDFDDLVHLDSVKNWRYRVTCMEQLSALITNLEVKSSSHRTIFIEMLKTRWLNVVFNFAEDSVWVVRSAAADVLIATLKKLVATNNDQSPPSYDSVIGMIEDRIIQFSESSTWYLRQLFLHSAIKITTTDVMSVATVDSLIMPKYLNLCRSDLVPNNRMVGGHGLEQICGHGYFTLTSEDNRKTIENVYHQLRSDKDRDVRMSVERLADTFVTVLS